MQSTAFVIVCLSTTFTITIGNGSINYCGSRMCVNTKSHTFCQYPEGPSPNCVGYIYAGLSEDEKSRVVARLNRRRNEAAAGKLRRLNSAGDMLKLRWVDELAREAQRWADQCRPPSIPEEHDECRDLYSISVGQCVASVVGEAPGLLIESMVDIWYMQNMLYKGNASIYVPPSQNRSFYGDFGQIIWAESYMVGCGRSRFMTPHQGRLRSVERLVCNIAPQGPPPLRPLWTPAAPAALCPSRSKQDSNLNALCDIRILDEIYLTRPAIAIMEDNYYTEIYNSIKRRDIANIKQLEGYKHEIITTPANKYTVKIKERKRINFIGRPKPYNMNELNDFDYKKEYYLQSEDVRNREKGFDAEYDFVESTEDTASFKAMETYSSIDSDNVSYIEIITELNAESKGELITSDYVNSNVLYKSEMSSRTDNINLIYTNPENTKSNVYIDGLTANQTLLTGHVGDYLAASESIQELEDALDRMEVELSSASSTERQGKVRRELRKLSDEGGSKGEFENFLNKEAERNRSVDQSYLYNLVFKYMPYLRQYDGGLLSTASNRANSISFFYLVLILCFFFLILV